MKKMVDRKLQLAIIGLGKAGEIHFKNVYNSMECDLKYALDESLERINYFRNLYNDDRIKYFNNTSYLNILDDSSLDGVLICTPTYTHEKYIVEALEKNKAVFCEKPLSITLESVERCYNLAAEKRVILHCSLNRRFDPEMQEIYNAIRNNTLGRIHIVKTCSRDYPKPSIDYLKVSGGLFHDCAIHDLDKVCWLLGKRPIMVYVTGLNNDSRIENINDVETAVVSLTFDDGTLAVLDFSRQSGYGLDQRTEVHGEKAMIESHNISASNVQLSSETGVLVPPGMRSFQDRYKQSYINSLNHFVESVREGKPTSVKADEVISLTKLAQACEDSCKLKKVISLHCN